MKRLFATPPAVLLAVALASLPATALATGPADERAADPETRDLPETRLRGVLFEGFRVGQTEFEVRATHADIDWSARRANLRAVEIQFLSKDRGTIQVRSDTGSVDLESEDFELTGNVHGITSRGERFVTDEVRYRQATNSLHGSGDVRLEREGLVFVGRGMDIDLETREVRFTGKVRATVRPK